jgi:CHAT domain-containing protein/tetratricopeptide (TPR) repeat protein
VDSLRRAGNAALGRDGFDAALAPWRESVRRARALADTAGMAAAYGNIGAGYYGEGSLDSAVAYFDRAAVMARAARDARTELNARGGRANVLRDRGEYAEARAEYERTLALRERIGDVRGIAADRTNLGILAVELGDADVARASYLEAIAISRRHALRDAEATALVNLGGLASEEADYADAAAHETRARTLYRELGDRQGEATTLHSLGLLELRRGDYPAAKRKLEAALALHRDVGPTAATVTVTADLARLSAAMGDPQAARAHLDRAQRLARRGEGPGLEGDVALLRGDLAAEYNAWPEANAAYREAASKYRAAADVGGGARAQHGLGLVQLADGDAAGAIGVLEVAAREFGAASDRRGMALAQLDLVAALAEAGDRPRARRVLATVQEALASLKDPAGVAASSAVLAELEMEDGRPAAAEALYRRALVELGSRPAVSVSWAIHAGLGDALAAQRAPGAAGAYRAAIAQLESTAGAVASRERRADWLADKWDVYASLAHLERMRGRDSSAFEVSERLRARAMLDGLGLGQVAWNAGADSTLVRREQELRRAVTELSRDVTPSAPQVLAVRGTADPRTAPLVAREALARAESERAEVLLTLRERAPGYAALVDGRTASWRDVTSRLPTGTVMLEYLLADSSATLFVLRPEGVRALDLSTDRKSVASLVEFARGLLARPSGADASRAVLERLYRLLLEPAEAAGLLEGTDRLLVVPHLELHYLPFAALRRPDAEGPYLVERYDIATVPSASVWLALELRGPAKSLRAAKVLALAPVATQLPGTRREVEGIAALAPARTTVLVGARATRRAFEQSMRGQDVVHLATYGVLNRRNPLFSYVELTSEPGRDGRLEVHDVYGLRLDARLVVLSACQTAVGSGLRADVPAGDEWVGLSQAFLAAGAERVLSTLWLVDDRATAELMTRFHATLAEGKGEASALAGVQRRAILNTRLADPYYWAGLTLMGGM